MEQSPWNQFNLTPATSAYLPNVHTINNTNNGSIQAQLLASQNAPLLSPSGLTSTIPNVSLSSASNMMGMASQYQMFTQNQPLLASNFSNQMVPRQMMTNQQSVQNQTKQQHFVQNHPFTTLQPPPNLNVCNVSHQNNTNQQQGAGKNAILRDQLFSGVPIRQPSNLLPPQQMRQPPPANTTPGARNEGTIQVQQNSRPSNQPAQNNPSTASKTDESKSQLKLFLADLKECSNKSKYYVSGTLENTYIVELLTFKDMCGEFLKRSNNTVLKDQIKKKLSTMKDGEIIMNAKVERSKFVQGVLDCIIEETNIWTPDLEPENPKSQSLSPPTTIRVSQANPPPNPVRVKKEPGTSTERCQTSCAASQVVKPTRITTPTSNVAGISFPSSIDELIRMSEEAAEPFNSVADGPNFASNCESEISQAQSEVKPQLLNKSSNRPAQEQPVLRQQAPVLNQQAPILRIQATFPRQQAPVLRQQAPVRHQQAPVRHQQAPVRHQQAPVRHQQAPVQRQQAPLLHQQVSLPRQQVPILLQKAPLPRQQTSALRQQAPVFGLQVPAGQQAPALQQNVNLNFIGNRTNVPLNRPAVPGIITQVTPLVPIRFGTMVTSANYAQPNMIQIIPNQNQSSPTVSSTTVTVNAQTNMDEIEPPKKTKRKQLVRPVSPNDMCRVELEDQKHISSCLIESKITDKKTKDIQKVKKEEVVCALSSDLIRETIIDPKESSYYWCNFCVYQTDHKGKLVNHVITAHRFSCQFCRFQCYSRADVVEHTVNVHREASTMSKDFRYCVLLPDYLKTLEKIENHENDSFENECIQSLKTKKIRGVSENDENYIESDWEEEILGDDDILSESGSEASVQEDSDSGEDQASKSPKQGKKRKIKRAFLNSSDEEDNEDQSSKRTKTSALEELKKKRKEKEKRKTSKVGRKKKESKKTEDENSDQDSPLKFRRRSGRNTKAVSNVFDPLTEIIGSDNESVVSDDTDNDKDFVPSTSPPCHIKTKTKDLLKSFLSPNNSKSNNSNNNADNLMPIAYPVVVLKPLDTTTSKSSSLDDHAPEKASSSASETVVSENSVDDSPLEERTNDDNDKDDEPSNDSTPDKLQATTTSSDSSSLTTNSVVSSASGNSVVSSASGNSVVSSASDVATSATTSSGKPKSVTSSAPSVTNTSTTSTNSNSMSGFSKNKVTLVKHCIHCDYVCDDIQEIKSHSLEMHPSAFLGVWQSALNFVLYICPNEHCDFYASMTQDFIRHIGRCSYTKNEDMDKAIKDTTNYIQCLKDKRLMKSSDLDSQKNALKQFSNRFEEWTVVKPVGMVSNIQRTASASPSPNNSPAPSSSSKSSDRNKPKKSSNIDDIMDSSTFYKCAFCSFKCMGNTLTVRAHSIKHHPEYPLYTINLRAVEEGHECRFVLFCVGQDCKEIFTQSSDYFKHVESCELIKKLKSDAQLLKTNKFIKSTMYKL